jgi:hypothetical protein
LRSRHGGIEGEYGGGFVEGIKQETGSVIEARLKNLGIAFME